MNKDLRLLKWIIGVILLALSLPLGAWLIYNRIDEAPSPAALRLGKPFEHNVPDRQNAWLYLMGMDAAPNEDPIHLGRMRVDMHNARMGKFPHRPADDAEKRLFEKRIALKWPDGMDKLCMPQQMDCVDWAVQHADLLMKARGENGLLLKRYDFLLTLTDWDSQFVPSLEAPYPDSKIDRLYLNLIASDAAQGDDMIKIFEKIKSSLDFYARMGEQSVELLDKMVALRRIMDRWSLLDSILMASEKNTLPFLSTMIAEIHKPPSASLLDLRRVLKHEYQTMLYAFNYAEFQPASDFGGFLVKALYLKQATVNLCAAVWEGIIELATVPAHQYDAALEKFTRERQKYFVPFEDQKRLMNYMSYNFSGKTLVAIGIPKFNDFILRTHDYEALRRFHVLKWRIRADGVAAERLDEYLLAIPNDLHNPYTLRPFSWNKERKELAFTPRSERWKDLAARLTMQ